MFEQEHPARLAGLLSQKYVSEKNRDAWLDLWAEEGVLADPVGPSPIGEATFFGRRGGRHAAMRV